MNARLGRLLAVLCLTLAACGGSGAPAEPYVRVSEATAAAPDQLPAPVADPVVTITGRISAATPDGISLDRAGIESMGLVRYTVRDPWLEQDLEFTGVLMTDLLAATGAAGDAQTLHITALDDYEVDIAIADVERWPVMLATQTGGSPMEIEAKGPTRVVFPADPAIDELKYKDLWIWQIKTIEVR